VDRFSRIIGRLLNAISAILFALFGLVLLTALYAELFGSGSTDWATFLLTTGVLFGGGFLIIGVLNYVILGSFGIWNRIPRESQ
jgi:hypothetical protein